MDVIGVDVGEGAPVVATFARAQGIGYPIVLDADKTTAIRYGVRGIPNIVLIDRTGTVRYQGYVLPDPGVIKKYE